MGHPDRKLLRERKRKKQAQLKKKNYLDVIDLTPYNAVKIMKNPKGHIEYR